MVVVRASSSSKVSEPRVGRAGCMRLTVLRSMTGNPTSDPYPGCSPTMRCRNASIRSVPFIALLSLFTAGSSARGDLVLGFPNGLVGWNLPDNGFTTPGDPDGDGIRRHCDDRRECVRIGDGSHHGLHRPDRGPDPSLHAGLGLAGFDPGRQRREWILPRCLRSLAARPEHGPAARRDGRRFRLVLHQGRGGRSHSGAGGDGCRCLAPIGDARVGLPRPLFPLGGPASRDPLPSHRRDGSLELVDRDALRC